jgi:hypothetical protein
VLHHLKLGLSVQQSLQASVLAAFAVANGRGFGHRRVADFPRKCATDPYQPCLDAGQNISKGSMAL